MSDVVISVENLSKRYLVGHNTAQGQQTADFRELISRNLIGLARRTRDMLNGRPILQGDAVEEFWALNDVSFEVKRGERLGIIGRNGAGKSTLLKILSRITEPTKGRVRITGRVASLLEVGTGFHPELSGRENIYLNGAMLGMSRAEVRRKFDEIVAFADVERFLDTPVKRYSSGMYVRLAFGVAAHLEPDILIVDEVLAVGDIQFQRKCLGRMEEAEKEGRTVIFVSHNMAMVSNLCRSGIYLENGKTAMQNDISKIIIEYYKNINKRREISAKAIGSETVEFTSIELAERVSDFETTIHDDLTVRMKYRVLRSVAVLLVPNFHFFSADGSYAFVSSPESVRQLSPGIYQADCKIPGGLLNEGTYTVGAAITSHFPTGAYEVDFFERNALMINIIDPMDIRTSRFGYAGSMPGVIRPKLEWSIAAHASE
jgi:lipopolysaccharide transport system ATP-binding protein